MERLFQSPLGETELVTHDTDAGDARPVRAMPLRLLYAVRKELEDELKQLLDIGCIEPSNSSYASPLVLVRLNRTLKAMLTKVMNKKGSDWDTKLGPVLMAYRTTPQSSTGVSLLLYGRDAKLPSALDFYAPKPPAVTGESEFGRKLFQELKKARELARQSIKNSQASQKKQCDKHAKQGG